jgi:ribosomal protein L7/L12
MSEESKCDCQHCGGHIAFPSEAAGQTVECPHCKCETLLSPTTEQTSQIVQCPCQHCHGEIEFDARELAEENSVVPCPHCGQETQLFITESKSGDQLPQSVMELIRNREKIAAIKELRSVNPGLLLSKAKQIVELAEANSASEAAEMLRKHKTDLGTSVTVGEPEKHAQLEQLGEIANRRIIYSNQDTLELRGDTITIKKRGWANALASGMNGARTIQLSSITAVQMKPAGMMMGYILFSYAGSKPFMGGMWEATQDPDAFLFGKDLNGQVAEFKAQVEKRMRESKQPAPAPANNPSGRLMDDLRKLVEFKNQGILSQAEFDAAKKKLLS